MALYIPKFEAVFIHIYKTAGTSLRLALHEIDENCEEIGIGHADYKEVSELIDLSDKKVFSVVRNPYDWVYSLYQYGLHYESHPFHKICLRNSFESFLVWYFENMYKYSLQSGINGKLQTQTDYLSDGDVIQVKHIFKMENLEQELNNSGIFENNIVLGRHNCTPYNKPDLSKTAIDMINNKYKNDFINFKYEML